MKKTVIDPADYAGAITKALRRGAFLNTKSGDKVNSMVIGWGHVGRIWEKDVFVAYVRHCRYTRELLDSNPAFTVSVPLEKPDAAAFRICGTESGRDQDKIEKARLTIVPPEQNGVPAIREFPLTLECRVIYREEQDASRLPDEIRRRFYTVERDDHISYYGEIVAAYLIED